MPKTPAPLPPLETLQALFSYDAATGALTNRVSRTSRKAGTRADVIREGTDYRMVYADGRLRLAHRVVWKFHYGHDPDGFIDHINGNKFDNRIENLRIATHPMNMCNRPAPPHNTSGAKGVYKRKDNGKWRAYVTVDGKRNWLGTFDSFEQADVAARVERRRAHGEFAHD